MYTRHADPFADLRRQLRDSLLPIKPILVPTVQDEFSYLQMADTFAHERLKSHTPSSGLTSRPPLVIQKPTDAPMYYTAQEWFLAIGQVVFGHPFPGRVAQRIYVCGHLLDITGLDATDLELRVLRRRPSCSPRISP